jgi:hypothetical protein
LYRAIFSGDEKKKNRWDEISPVKDGMGWDGMGWDVNRAF